jgi:RNA polymerase sigma-70 factor (ECF subfamily)
MSSRDSRAVWLARYVLPHEPALRAWLRRKAVAGLEIDDIVQETYARFSTMESVDNVRNPKTYLFQTAHSIIVSFVRRSRIVPILAVGHLEAFEMASEEPDLETQTNDLQELQRLAEAIATLPDKVRDVFVLRRVHGLSQREVAERLGLAESTVEKHMSKGFALIAERFSRGGNEAPRASNKMPQDKEQDHVPDRSED